jgi:phage/conjugal plasmid C-4 type zinc finger TraR family protein
VNEQIEASIAEELERMRVERESGGESRETCLECDEPIPERRRRAMPGVTLCLECQAEQDQSHVRRGGINRRGSKDSQLK